MTIQRTVLLTKAEDLFPGKLPIYVNRVIESFDLMEHSHDFIEICYVGGGAGTHYIQDRTLSVKQGDIFFLPVGIHHVFRPASIEKQHSLVVYNCVFSPSLFDKVLGAFPLNDEMNQFYKGTEWLRFSDELGEFHRLFQKLHYEYAAKKLCFEAILYTCLLELLLYLFRHNTLGQSAQHFNKANSIEAVLHYIHNKYAQPITISDLTPLLGLGERQFHRVFKQHTGMNLTDYVQTVRIREASNLLRTTDRKISDIAGVIGYQDIKFFNHVFKKKTGVTPRQYRNKYE